LIQTITNKETIKKTIK